MSPRPTARISLFGSLQDSLVSSTITELDIMGMPAKNIQFAAGNSPPRGTTFERDALGRLSEQNNEDGTQQTYLYGLSGSLLESCEWDGQGSLCTNYDYDRAGRTTKIIDPAGTETFLEYSSLGELLKRDQNIANGSFEEIHYDGFGRPIAIQDRQGIPRNLQYDPNTGDLLYDIGALAGEVSYEYDPLGRLTYAKRTSPLDSDTSFRQTTGFDREASVEHEFTYDNLGRLSTEDITIADVSFPTIQRSYFLRRDSSAESITFPYRQEDRLYDGHGRMNSLNSDVLPNRTDFSWLGAQYAGQNQLIEGKPPTRGNFSEDRFFNDFGELTEQTYYGASQSSMDDPSFRHNYCQGHSNCSDILIGRGLKRDSAGRILQVTTDYEFPTGSPRTARTFDEKIFSFNTRGHLDSFTESGEFPARNETYEHEISYARGTHGSVDSWTFSDGPNNLISNDLVYDATRRNDGRADEFQLDKPGSPVETVKYDDRGMIAVLGEFRFEYDQWQQLTSVHSARKTDYQENYLYDFAGRLVAVIQADPEGQSAASMDLFIVDGQNPVEQWRASADSSNGGASLTFQSEFIWGPMQQQMIAARTEETGGDLLFPLTDERQSIIGVWNETEFRMTEYVQYDPEGRMRVRDADDDILCSERNLEERCEIPSLKNFGFTGAYRSSITGLHRFGARWYSSRHGQFISPDPLWYIDSFDVYGYSGFDPVNFWDPSGMSSTGTGDINPINPPEELPYYQQPLDGPTGFEPEVEEDGPQEQRQREDTTPTNSPQRGTPCTLATLAICSTSNPANDSVQEQMQRDNLPRIENRDPNIRESKDFIFDVFVGFTLETVMISASPNQSRTPGEQLGRDLTIAQGGIAIGRQAFLRVLREKILDECFVAGTGIHMISGTARIEEIRRGDLVFGYGTSEEGTWVKIDLEEIHCTAYDNEDTKKKSTYNNNNNEKEEDKNEN